MKKNIVKAFCIWVILSVSQNAQAQSFGVSAQWGSYDAKYATPDNVEQEVTGKSYISIGGVYEQILTSNSQLTLPIQLQFAHFGTEQSFGETQLMTHSANTMSLGAGLKYYTRGTDFSLRPFVALNIGYEAYVNSKYYLNDEQSGELDWKSNLNANIQGGIGFETGLNTRIDLFVTYNLGLLNRLDKSEFGTYTDQMLGLGCNVVFY